MPSLFAGVHQSRLAQCKKAETFGNLREVLCEWPSYRRTRANARSLEEKKRRKSYENEISNQINVNRRDSWVGTPLVGSPSQSSRTTLQFQAVGFHEED